MNRFTLNFLSFDHYDEIDQCGRVHGNDVDKLSTSGLNSKTSDVHRNHIIDQAEGIERAEEANFCSQKGAGLAQGYYYEKPSSAPIRKI